MLCEVEYVGNCSASVFKMSNSRLPSSRSFDPESNGAEGRRPIEGMGIVSWRIVVSQRWSVEGSVCS